MKSERISILFFIDGLGSGGAQKQIVTLAVSLSKLGYEVVVCYYHEEEFFYHILDSNGIKRHLFKRGSSRLKKIRLPLELATFVRQNKIRTVISFLDGPNFYSEIARVLSLFNFNLIVSERFMTVGDRSFAQRFLAKFHYLANFITTNSHHQRNRMVSDESWMKKRIYTIYNGYQKPTLQKLISTSNFFVHRPVRFLVVSSVASKKNPINLIYAFNLLKLKGFSFDVRWAGATSTTKENDSIYKECLTLIQRFNLTECFSFIGEVTDIGAEYYRADWLIHPSFYEGLPNAICEAISHSLPVLASDVCDHRILVKDSSCGYVFNPHHIDSIFEVLTKAVTIDFQDYTLLSKSCSEYFDANLNVSKFSLEYKKLIDSI